MQKSEKKRSSKKTPKQSVSGLIVIFLLLCISILGIGAALGVEKIHQQAEIKFGLPDPELSSFDKLNYSIQILLAEKSLLMPTNSQGLETGFTISQGESADTISQRLNDGGIISDKKAFLTFLIYSGLDSHIQAGDYLLSPKRNGLDVARMIGDANQTRVKFGFLPGWRVEEISGLLVKSGLQVDGNEFLNLVHSPPAQILPAELEGVTTLEGFLFPDLYELDRTTDTVTFIKVILENFVAHLTPDIRLAFKDEGLSLQQAVTLASLVQKEAIVEEEQTLIASVFLNRISAGMKFESDPTVQYAVGFYSEENTWWKNPLTLDDLKIDSPYNTYLYAGFPPGPISNPGIKALQAVAFPAKTPYYYFRARCDGSGRHTFANSFDEHIQNECQN